MASVRRKRPSLRSEAKRRIETLPTHAICAAMKPAPRVSDKSSPVRRKTLGPLSCVEIARGIDRWDDVRRRVRVSLRWFAKVEMQHRWDVTGLGLLG